MPSFFGAVQICLLHPWKLLVQWRSKVLLLVHQLISCAHQAALLSITNCCALLMCVTAPWGFARGLVRLYLETPSTAPCAAILVFLKQEEFSFASAAAPAKPSGKCAQLLSTGGTLFCILASIMRWGITYGCLLWQTVFLKYKFDSIELTTRSK